MLSVSRCVCISRTSVHLTCCWDIHLKMDVFHLYFTIPRSLVSYFPILPILCLLFTGCPKICKHVTITYDSILCISFRQLSSVFISFRFLFCCFPYCLPLTPFFSLFTSLSLFPFCIYSVSVLFSSRTFPMYLLLIFTRCLFNFFFLWIALFLSFIAFPLYSFDTCNKMCIYVVHKQRIAKYFQSTLPFPLFHEFAYLSE